MSKKEKNTDKNVPCFSQNIPYPEKTPVAHLNEERLKNLARFKGNKIYTVSFCYWILAFK